MLFAAFVFVGNTLRKRSEYNKLNPNELSVIIPFRNEATRIHTLLNSLREQTTLPHHVYFVNDHSTDGGEQLIYDLLNNSQVSFSVLSLPPHRSGKKGALLEGIQHAKTPFCLTLDADVVLPEDYFVNLPELNNYAMVCLPVRMTGQDIQGKLMELEYGSFQLLQGAVNENSPLMASGANLLINRDDYLKFNDISKHQHIASGDDQFALAQLVKKGKKARYSLALNQTVYTEVPQSLGELLAQRVRWMGNNTAGNDWRAVFFACWVFVINVGFISLLISSVFQRNFPLAFQVFISKFSMDFVTYVPWFYRHHTWSYLFFLPLLQLSYPVFLIALGVGYVVGINNWKGRSVR